MAHDCRRWLTAGMRSPRSASVCLTSSSAPSEPATRLLRRTSCNQQYDLYGGHAYMFDGLTVTNGVTYVDLLNPWGFAQPEAVPVSAWGSVFDGIDIGQFGPVVPPTVSGSVPPNRA